MASGTPHTPSDTNVVAPIPFEPDLSKPIVFQVGHLLDRYDLWVHKPIISKKGLRMFEWDFMESLTYSHFWAVPLVWLPVVVFSILKSLSLGSSPASASVAMAQGILIWSGLEYLLHRFLFHWKTSTYWTKTLHYLLHGVHHKHPQDQYRLATPPALVVVFLCVLAPPFALVLPQDRLYALFSGTLLGYVVYGVLHFWCHFGMPWKIEPFASMRKYHLAHHFRNNDLGFGVTSTLWDQVFGTYPQATLKH